MSSERKRIEMQGNMTRRTSSFFDSYAEDFTSIYGNEHTPFNRFINERFRKSMRQRYEMSINRCQPIEGRSVLDIGCGPGHYGVALARQGASKVLGVDFADGMLEIARQAARKSEVENVCEFRRADFMTFSSSEKFDYSIVMGFMDYMEDPQKIVDKVLSLTNIRAVFSFPVGRGFLAWQRRLRYRWKCDLFMYDRQDLEQIFENAACGKVSIEEMARDYFVTAEPLS